MLTEFRLAQVGKNPCIELNVPLLTWQDWMHDNLSLLSFYNENTAGVALFSFRTGTVLARINLKAEQIKELFGNEVIAVAPLSISEKIVNEGLVFKKEEFDDGGKFFRGILSQTAGDIEQAIACYKEVVLQKPGLYRAHSLLGLCYRIKGDNESAEKSYLQSIELKPQCPETLSNLGILCMKTGRAAEAEKLFNRALEADEFYLNALLNLSRIYRQNKNVLDSDYLRINLKLRQLYSSLPAVLECLNESAQLGKMTISQYSERLGSSSDYLNSSQIIKTMQSIETLVLNSASFAALAAIKRLIKDNSDTFHFDELVAWGRARLDRLSLQAQSFKYLDLFNAISVLQAEVPELKKTDQQNGFSPLTRIEFFSLVILEVMRDGQIEQSEKKMVAKLKDFLEITDMQYQQIINKIRSQVRANPFIEKEPKGFQSLRLFRALVRSAFRDKVIEEEEKKILVFASKAFGVAQQDANRIMAEVANDK